MLVGKGFEIFPEVSVTKVIFVSQTLCLQKNQKSQNLWELIDQFTNAIQYNTIPIVIGETWLMTLHLSKMFKNLDLDDIDQLVLKVQRSALIGTLKIVKSVLKMT